MQPQLNPGDWVFATVPTTAALEADAILMQFKEAEGITVIVPKAYADANEITYSYVAAWITLTVHSSLEAAGLTAAFSGALAAAQISCNVVAAFYHDHIFVAKADAEKAMNILEELAAGKRQA